MSNEPLLGKIVLPEQPFGAAHAHLEAENSRLASSLAKAIALLEEAKVVLERYWFSDSDGESYNNEDVIGIDDKISAFLSNR